MALIECENCGKKYSDTVNKCPNCGYEYLLVICPECETFNIKTDEVCRKCGADFNKIKPCFTTKDLEREYYNTLVSKLELEDNDLKKLEKMLAELAIFSDFENSEENIAKCKQLISDLKQEEQNEKVYVECCESIKIAQTSFDWEEICKKLETIISYKDVKTLYDESMEKYKECIYNDCLAKEAICLNSKGWNELKCKYEFLKDYKDSTDRAKSCQEKSFLIKTKKKKRIITVFSIFVGIVILAVITYYVIIPGLYYTFANSKFENGDYANAVSLYKKAGDFFDSADKADLATKADFYMKAENCGEKANYSEAAKLYAQAGDYKDSQKKLFNTAKILIEKQNYNEASIAFSLYNGGDKYKTYADGMSALYSNNFSKAIEYFEKITNIEDSAERLKEANYKEGKRLFSIQSYSSAQEYFKSADGYSDAKTMIIACDLMEAEKLYDDGSLNSAKAAFKALPKNFSYGGISVSKRLSTLSKYDTYVKMCGKWTTSKKSTSKVTQTYKETGSWEYWTTDYSNSHECISLKCVINDNGSVKIKGTAEYTYDTEYSSLSAYLKPYSATSTINKTVKKVPNGLKIDDYTTITYSGGKWKLRYHKYSPNESIDFSYTYESNYNYGKRLEKY